MQLFDDFISEKKVPIISDVVLFELVGAPEEVKSVLKRVPDENIEYVPLSSDEELRTPMPINAPSFASQQRTSAKRACVRTP